MAIGATASGSKSSKSASRFHTDGPGCMCGAVSLSVTDRYPRSRLEDCSPRNSCDGSPNPLTPVGRFRRPQWTFGLPSSVQRRPPSPLGRAWNFIPDNMFKVWRTLSCQENKMLRLGLSGIFLVFATTNSAVNCDGAYVHFLQHVSQRASFLSGERLATFHRRGLRIFDACDSGHISNPETRFRELENNNDFAALPTD